jgi:hypothetical protein
MFVDNSRTGFQCVSHVFGNCVTFGHSRCNACLCPSRRRAATKRCCGQYGYRTGSKFQGAKQTRQTAADDDHIIISSSRHRAKERELFSHFSSS